MLQFILNCSIQNTNYYIALCFQLSIIYSIYHVRILKASLKVTYNITE